MLLSSTDSKSERENDNTRHRFASCCWSRMLINFLIFTARKKKHKNVLIRKIHNCKLSPLNKILTCQKSTTVKHLPLLYVSFVTDLLVVVNFLLLAFMEICKSLPIFSRSMSSFLEPKRSSNTTRAKLIIKIK